MTNKNYAKSRQRFRLTPNTNIESTQSSKFFNKIYKSYAKKILEKTWMYKMKAAIITENNISLREKRTYNDIICLFKKLLSTKSTVKRHSPNSKWRYDLSGITIDIILSR